MPAYNFKKEFRQKILRGEKRTTIRRRRKRPTQVGNLLYLYIGMRTKQCKRIAVARCRKITPIIIWPEICEMAIVEEGGKHTLLQPHQVVAIAWLDGFDDALKFYDFFYERYAKKTNAIFRGLDDFEIIEFVLVPDEEAR